MIFLDLPLIAGDMYSQLGVGSSHIYNNIISDDDVSLRAWVSSNVEGSYKRGAVLALAIGLFVEFSPFRVEQFSQ